MSKITTAGASTLLLGAVLAGGTTLVGTGSAQAADAGAAAPRVASRTFQTVGTDVNMRRCSDTSNSLCSVVHAIHAKGSSVELNCWEYGTSVSGDNIWYQVVRYEGGTSYHGHVAGYWLNTGTDPRSGIGYCRS